MSYSQFSIDTVETTLGITIVETVGIFADTPPVEYSDFLAQTLKKYIPLALAIGTEKSRSELILTPILVELKEQFQNKISLFSGREFNVSPEKSLTGFCDFLISKSSEQIIIKAPVIALVEAKNDNIQSGLGQCIAEMVAAQLFNQQKENEIKTIYGSVTTGTNWKFMRLSGQIIEIDLNEYFINDVRKILGILRSFIESSGN
ncbi:hypothetical protein PI95_023300 [Hassallia byssoidea VB512170]|uniref:Uncharacterized protein n=1 Tax=Hassallia byssoidea VB512170 TaxID=1304833 RepID=A0A846HDD2_9CYAN|nr:hypothetical protein [Hassalia byssoidea]NEU75402.1 hypothetical protein [Hassalia byssoidea VB512170]